MLIGATKNSSALMKALLELLTSNGSSILFDETYYKSYSEMETTP